MQQVLRENSAEVTEFGWGLRGQTAGWSRRRILYLAVSCLGSPCELGPRCPPRYCGLGGKAASGLKVLLHHVDVTVVDHPGGRPVAVIPVEDVEEECLQVL